MYRKRHLLANSDVEDCFSFLYELHLTFLYHDVVSYTIFDCHDSRKGQVLKKVLVFTQQLGNIFLIHPSSPLVLFRVTGGWSLSQLSLGQRRPVRHWADIQDLLAVTCQSRRYRAPKLNNNGASLVEEII